VDLHRKGVVELSKKGGGQREREEEEERIRVVGCFILRCGISWYVVAFVVLCEGIWVGRD
jgi:hypothetical protein